MYPVCVCFSLPLISYERYITRPFASCPKETFPLLSLLTWSRTDTGHCRGLVVSVVTSQQQGPWLSALILCLFFVWTFLLNASLENQNSSFVLHCLDTYSLTVPVTHGEKKRLFSLFTCSRWSIQQWKKNHQQLCTVRIDYWSLCTLSKDLWPHSMV